MLQKERLSKHSVGHEEGLQVMLTRVAGATFILPSQKFLLNLTDIVCNDIAIIVCHQHNFLFSQVSDYKVVGDMGARRVRILPNTAASIACRWLENEVGIWR